MLFHSLPLTSVDLHILSSNFRIEQTMSREWFGFCDPPKVADSLPDNKIVQVLSNFDSFHWLTTIRAIPQDTEMEQKSRDMALPWALLQHEMCSHFSILSVPGQGNSSRTSYPTPAVSESHSTGITGRKSIPCRTAAPSSSWETFGTVRCLGAGFRQLQP